MSDTTTALSETTGPHAAADDSEDVEPRVRELIEDGLIAHQNGDLTEAENKYRDALKLSPQDSEGLHLLAIIACQSASYDAAITLFGHAIANHPDHPNVPPRYNVNLANALHGARRLEDAVVALHRALSADPSSVEAHYNLGNVLSDLARYEEAEGEYRFAIQLQPNYGKAHARLSWVLQQQGHLQEAIEEMQVAANINPEDGTLRVGLGRALAEDGRFEQAMPYLEGIQESDDAEAWTALGSCFAAQQKWAEAKDSYSHGMKLAPREAKAHAGLGEALYHLGQSEQALSHLIRATELDPNNKRASARAGMINLDQGDFHLATERLEDAIIQTPEDHHAHSALILAKCLVRTAPDDGWKAECQRWTERHANGRAMPLGRNDRLDPHRTLCVGFVTGSHPGDTALQALLSILGYRRREAIETRCYVDLDEREPLFEPLKALADGWVDARGMTDGELCSAIHGDRVDILIDLAGCRPGNRLRTLARRPAPIQIDWLGTLEPGGFPFIDHCFADARYGDEDDDGALPLTDGLLSFVPPEQYEQPGPLPMLDGSPPVFVCLGDLAQLSEESIALFSRVLTAVPDSRLHLIKRQPIHRETSRRFRRRFADYGVAEDRLGFYSLADEESDVKSLLADADLVLDTFPTSNGFESFFALLAGLPVITLQGPTAASQLSAGMLKSLGLESLVTSSIQEFESTVQALVNNPQKVVGLREALPGMIAESPLVDGATFAKTMELALRSAWTTHCAERHPAATTRH